ncbi:hypothetical protein H634G_04469 [Metarhizium anisopliae BRIP 53293]|uniref:Uncharacterized protein n=1 Tax=Metarhizium anisopliae BRIP 53293 TaxID=1291518 RepID=A0A0D9P5Y2_METAN|nr:hypothetical protein H634G_04469 [Metarhizium anisopliae BRIP 53293]KJK89910.1 hypothetical protein H633G_06221 [Metarhizium anisopliae BRIP 53284]
MDLEPMIGTPSQARALKNQGDMNDNCLCAGMVNMVLTPPSHPWAEWLNRLGYPVGCWRWVSHNGAHPDPG